MRKVGKILRRETDDYTDFEGGVPRKAPVRRTRRTASPAAQRRNDDQTCCSAEREDRDRYGIENHPVGRLGADWNEYYRI